MRVCVRACVCVCTCGVCVCGSVCAVTQQPAAVACTFIHTFLTSLPLCRLPSILEYLREPLQAGLADRSAYVRKTAVMGIVKIFYIAPTFITGIIL